MNSTLVPQIMSQSVLLAPHSDHRNPPVTCITFNNQLTPRVSPSLQRRPPTAQIPIAEHVARRGPPNAPKSRFRPLEVFVRRPPAFVARFEAAGIRKPSQKPALPHRNMGVCFDLQQRTLSIVFSVAP